MFDDVLDFILYSATMLGFSVFICDFLFQHYTPRRPPHLANSLQEYCPRLQSTKKKNYTKAGMEFAFIASVIGVANATISNLNVVKDHLKAYRKLRSVLRDATTNMETLIDFLVQLEDDERASQVSDCILVRARDKLDGINKKLGKVQDKFTGAYRGIWNLFAFVLASSVYEHLKEVSAAVEPLHKHLEVCNLGFKSIGMQLGLQNTMDEMKGTPQTLVTLGHHPRPDVALTPEIVPFYAMQFTYTHAHHELSRSIQNKNNFMKFCTVLANDVRHYLRVKRSFRNEFNQCSIAPDIWNVADVFQAVST